MRELYENLKASSEQRYLDVFESANDAIFTISIGEMMAGITMKSLIELAGK